MIYLDYQAISGGDPYWANVVLLVQGGTDGGTLVQDLSSYGDSVTITTGFATFDNDHQVFGNNPIKTIRVSAGVPAFSSSGGSTDRFGRVAAEKTTIECWLYIDTLENYAPSSFCFSWWQQSSRILEVGTYGGTSVAKIRWRSGDDADLGTAAVSVNTAHFLQLNIDAGAWTLDLDGVEIYSGTNNYGNDQAGAYNFYVASQTASGLDTAPSTKTWVGPLRMTKGVCRARGTVPTAPFPTR